MFSKNSKGTKAQLAQQRTPVSHELQRHHEEVMEEAIELRKLEEYFSASSKENEVIH